MSAARARRQAVLLLNVGSPDSPEPAAVRRYLAQFLSDPRVVDIPWLPRQLLLRAVILPTRPKKSSAAYKLVWRQDGSPLVAISRAQAAGLSARLGVPVHLAMRYGQPTIESAVSAIAADQAEDVVIVPLFPQYSSAATGSALQAVFQAFGRLPFVPALSVLRPMWDDPGVLDAFAERAREAIGDAPVDRLLCSFHGLPERQVRATDHSGGCLPAGHEPGGIGCCADPGPRLALCYRAQCYATAAALGQRLGLPVTVAFQSRLGRTPWIQPFTDHVLPRLVGEGARDIAVICPSFVADCLETLEEIAIRGREQHQAAGGGRFVFVPCPNDHPRFLDALARLVGARLGDPR